MPTITAQAILSKVELLIQDTTNIRWSENELLGWLNDGQREICTVKPDASTKVASMALAAGTKQAIPADGTAAIKVTRNMGAGGSTPGGAVRKVPMELLDSSTPNWHTATATATVLHFSVDPRMPRNFYVYPPSLGTTQVELLYAAAPTDVAAVGNTISIDDLYATALIDYIAYRAYLKDHELIGNDVRAASHYKLFSDFLTRRTQVDSAVVPTRDNVKG
jgi:hypothetical protein